MKVNEKTIISIKANMKFVATLVFVFFMVSESSPIDELACVHSFNSNEVLMSLLELVRISEDNLSKWSTSSCVVNNVLDNSLNISISLWEIKFSKLSGAVLKWLFALKTVLCLFLWAILLNLWIIYRNELHCF